MKFNIHHQQSRGLEFCQVLAAQSLKTPDTSKPWQMQGPLRNLHLLWSGFSNPPLNAAILYELPIRRTKTPTVPQGQKHIGVSTGGSLLGETVRPRRSPARRALENPLIGLPWRPLKSLRENKKLRESLGELCTSGGHAPEDIDKSTL